MGKKHANGFIKTRVNTHTKSLSLSAGTVLLVLPSFASFFVSLPQIVFRSATNDSVSVFAFLLSVSAVTTNLSKKS